MMFVLLIMRDCISERVGKPRERDVEPTGSVFFDLSKLFRHAARNRASAWPCRRSHLCDSPDVIDGMYPYVIDDVYPHVIDGMYDAVFLIRVGGQ